MPKLFALAMGLHRHTLLPLLGLAGLIFSVVDAVAPLRNLCPVTCLEAGPNPSKWTVIAEFSQLQACQKPMILDFSVRIPVTEKQHIRVCNVVVNHFDNKVDSNIALALAEGEVETKQVNPQLAWTPAASKDDIGGRLVVQSVEHLQSYLLSSRKTSNRVTLFGTVSGTTVGVYVGANILGSSTAGDLFDSFLNNLYSTGIANSKAALVQLCEGRSGDDIFGLIAASSESFSTVHDAVGRWSNGTCVDTSSYAERRELNATAVAVIKPTVWPTPSNGTAVARAQSRAIYCRTEKVMLHDDCPKLTTRCGGGLTLSGFYKYNPTIVCNDMMPGQFVCCTSGSLPDMRPKPRPDGSCFPYQNQHDDWCHKVAVANGLTVEELIDLNKDTWGFSGCGSGFWADNWICLSTGTPPFPAPIANAVCGPQKPGTTKPSGSTSRDWAKLNPCPLNSCCNIWGQCGTTTDFCIDTNTGPPGTAKVDTYGCISNCGMSIVRSGPPAQFIKLGYFEGFNLGRECLNMDATQIDPSFTHVHFAFGMISAQFEVYQEDLYSEFQFQQFKKITTAKRIISFGGWVFSAEAPNYPIFRNAVSTAANREKLATNLVGYVMNNGLDGLDIDWEYPAAPDLPDIPKGDLSEAVNYLRLLAVIRSKLPKDKTLSIAAPSSYWYLKQFPIKAMAELLDYIVYMTYDLHGQWDAGNKWANPGCPTGNCLRSHINRTETMSALTLITKAGVPSNKVLVGISSYGRSFQMVDPSCTGPNCLYTGDRKTSYARPGRCTETSGYLANAEIDEIGGRTWTDVASNSKIMVDGDLWVSYMDNTLKESRTLLYQRYNMGGTVDWAVDLVQFHDTPYGSGSGIPEGGGSGGGGPSAGIFNENWTKTKNQIKVGGTFNQIDCTAAKEKRTGTWVDKTCSTKEATSLGRLDYSPGQRWTALDCDHAWDDSVNIWNKCYRYEDDPPSFTEAMAAFFGEAEGSKCDDLAAETNCHTGTCKTPEPFTPANPELNRGPCAFLIWNSIATTHAMLKNYNAALSASGVAVTANQETFMKTFAPTSLDLSELFGLLLSLIPVPLSSGISGFLSIDMMQRAFKKASSDPSAMQDKVTGLIDTAESIGKEKLLAAAKSPEKVSFDTIYSKLIDNWKSQIDLLIAAIFKGDDISLGVLENLFSGGMMIDGKADAETIASNHTASWAMQSNLERAFYAAAIPAAWTANGPAPVIVDFGPGCEIDARKYFGTVDPDRYNVGWRCINNNSFILAGVRDIRQEICLPNNYGDQGTCTGSYQWTLNVLPGIDSIPDNIPEGGTANWAGVTVSDLIMGGLNTFFANQAKNIMDPSQLMTNTRDIAGEYKANKMDIRKPGLIRIPVCDAEEAKANLAKGRDSYGDSANYPCNP